MERTHSLLCCAAAAVLLTGCLGPGTTRTTRLFVLDAAATPPASRDGATDIRLGVGRVLLSEWLNRPQIVSRVGANRVRMADFSQWAEPLEKGIQRVLSENLVRLTGSDQVFFYPWPSRTEIDLMVEVAVIQFGGDTDGDVSLAARWRLIGPDGLEARPLQSSSYAESAADRSTDALVAAMSRTLDSLSRDIAFAIAATLPEN